MGILYIDSSSRIIEFGYSDHEGSLLKQRLDIENNADTLMYFISVFFRQNKFSTDNINYVSISNGPGSFTGLRISSAIAKAICYSLQSTLIELSSLDIIANKKKSTGRIIPLIFSNTRTNEFFYSEYVFENENLIRISDHKTGLLENIINDNALYLINEKISENIPEVFRNRITDVSQLSNIDSMHELTIKQIDRNEFSDYRTSEPFYLKEFVPNN
ncbi:MAG: tRNA (adenosine(37)-N6)-threonylcarbamoyltransferase complex dimerization subunit type 1 TsaB [Ignavibacteria bacterium]